MKRIFAFAILAASFLAPHAGRAQSAPIANPKPSPATLAKYDRNRNGVLDPEGIAAKQADETASKDGTVTLSPFEVVTDRDTSYGALNSNSIAAINMQLLKAPVAADIFT